MSTHVTVRLDRRLLEHPRAYHLRRMRMGVWLYLALLARLPAGKDTLDLDPAELAGRMGLVEAQVRSWLGHLRRWGYLRIERLNGTLRVMLRDVHPPTVDVDARTPRRSSLPRFFTAEKLEDALSERGQREALEGALSLHSDSLIRRALAGCLAVPAPKIRRSRTALFLYLLKRHAHEPT